MPARAALQMAVDRMLIVLTRLPVMGKAGGRGIAHLVLLAKRYPE